MGKSVREEQVLLIAGIALIVAIFGLFALLIFSLVYRSVTMYRKRRRLNPASTLPDSRPDSVTSSTISRLSSAVSVASSLANGDLPVSKEKAFGGRTFADEGIVNGKVNNNNILHDDLERGIISAGDGVKNDNASATQHTDNVTTTTTTETLRLNTEPPTTEDKIPPPSLPLGACRFSPKTSARSAKIADEPPSQADSEVSVVLAETVNVTFENLEAITERAFQAELRKTSLASTAVSRSLSTVNDSSSPPPKGGGGCKKKVKAGDDAKTGRDEIHSKL